MQTDVISQRCASAAHSNVRVVTTSASQLVLDDRRIRAWSLAGSGNAASQLNFAAAQTSASVFVRARPQSTCAFEIHTASPGSAITWTKTNGSQFAYPNSQPALFVSGCAVAAFWLDKDGVSIKTQSSSDNGATWGASALVATLSTQYVGAAVCLAAPASNLVFWTNSPSPTSALQWSYRSGSAWSSASSWTLDYQNLGVGRTTQVFGLGYKNHTLSAVSASGNLFFTFYAESPRNSIDRGVWVLKAFATGASTYSFGELLPVYAGNFQTNVPANNPTNVSGIYVGFPKIQAVGSEHWITSVETSQFAGYPTAHLAVFRSRDCQCWTEREYFAVGTDLEYSGSVAFLLKEFLYSQMLVSGTRIYLVGYDAVFWAEGSSICGVTNATKTLDLTPHVPNWNMTLPPAGQAGNATLTLNNPQLLYNSASLLIDGARIVHKAGYVTTTGSGELVTMMTGVVDTIDHPTAIGGEDVGGVTNQLTVRTMDYVTKLATEPDAFYEFKSATQILAQQFSDLTALGIANGSFFVSGGDLIPGLIEASDKQQDNLAIFSNIGRNGDGAMELEIRCAASLASDYAGVAFRLTSGQNYYAALYNNTASRFTLVQAIANAASAVKNLTYTTLAQSNVVTFDANAGYAMRVHWEKDAAQVYYGANLAPPQVNSIANAAGGSLTASTKFYYQVTAQAKLTGEETMAGIDISASTTVANRTINLGWLTAPGASVYKVYRTTASGAFSASSYAGSTTGLTFSDTGAALTAGSPPTTHLRQRRVWQNAVSACALQVDAGFAGIILKGTLVNSAPIGQPNQVAGATARYYIALNDENTANRGGGRYVDCFVRIKTVGVSVLRTINACISRVFNTAAWTIPNIVISLVKDNGAGTYPADLSDPSNTLYSDMISPAAIPLGSAYGYIAPISIYAQSQVDLAANTYYWIRIRSQTDVPAELVANSDVAVLIYRPHTAGGTGNNPSYEIYDGTLTSFYPVPGEFNAWITTAVQATGFTAQRALLGTGETPKSAELIAKDIAAKAQMEGIRADSFIQDSGSAFQSGSDGSASPWNSGYTGTWSSTGSALQGLGASATSYGFVRSNSALGTVADTWLEFDLTLLANTVKAGVLMHLSGTPSDATLDGYYLEFAPSASAGLDRVLLYTVADNVLTKRGECTSLRPFPINQSFRATVVCSANFYTVFVNETLAATFFENTFAPGGYVGLAAYGNLSGSAVARFANFRVPDIPNVEEHFLVEANSPLKNALDRLVGKNRVLYYADYSGALRLSRFARRSVADYYSNTIVQAQQIASGRYWVSHLRPEGSYFADRFDATMLDERGRRYKRFRYTDAYTDAQAYTEGQFPIRQARELQTQQRINTAAVASIEREDVIQVTNSMDGTSASNFIVTDLNFEFEIGEQEGSVRFDQSVALRRYVS